jgi:hypothetical protein
MPLPMLVEAKARGPEPETPTMATATKGKPRWRFTIGSMMLGIVYAAVFSRFVLVVLPIATLWTLWPMYCDDDRTDKESQTLLGFDPPNRDELVRPARAGPGRQALFSEG